jgi:hypothetical protein
MTRRRSDSAGGGFTVSNNQGDVVIANGDQAQAINSVRSDDAAALDRAPIERELALLRAQLAELRHLGEAGLRPEDAAAAEQDVTALDHEIQRDQPDSAEISRRLGRLSIVLGSVAGLTETVVRLGTALRGLIGLG